MVVNLKRYCKKKYFKLDKPAFQWYNQCSIKIWRFWLTGILSGRIMLVKISRLIDRPANRVRKIKSTNGRRCVIIGPKKKNTGEFLRIGRTSARSREAEKALVSINITPQQFLIMPQQFLNENRKPNRPNSKCTLIQKKE